MPLVKHAKTRGVETIFVLDDAAEQLIANAPGADAPHFQQCPFEALDERVLAAIEAWRNEEPAIKKPKLADEKTRGLALFFCSY